MSWGVSKRLKRILGFAENLNDERASVGQVWKIPQENPFAGNPKPESTSNPKLYSSTLSDEQAAARASEYWKKQSRTQEGGAAGVHSTDTSSIKEQRRQEVNEMNKRYTKGY